MSIGIPSSGAIPAENRASPAVPGIYLGPVIRHSNISLSSDTGPIVT